VKKKKGSKNVRGPEDGGQGSDLVVLACLLHILLDAAPVVVPVTDLDTGLGMALQCSRA
jgi:hypothetical protein